MRQRKRFRGIFCAKKADVPDIFNLDARKMGQERNCGNRLFSAENSTETLASQARS